MMNVYRQKKKAIDARLPNGYYFYVEKSKYKGNVPEMSLKGTT